MKLKHALAGGAAAAAAFAAVAGPLASQVTLYGGGATFPAPAYIGTSYVASGNRLTNPPDAGSVFDAYVQTTTGVNVSYCQTGSGTGKKVLDGATGFAATNMCPSFAVSATGFGKPATGAAPLDDADFVGSDAPISQAEFDATKANKQTHTQAVQFPVLAGAVGISFNHPDASTLNLTTAQLCGVFNGTIIHWSDLGVTVTGSNPTSITVQVRSDGSGTTYSLSNHLAAVCNAITSPTFTVTQNPYIGNVVMPAAGSTFSAHSGNFGVNSAVNTTAGSIGYADVADGLARVPKLKFATINGFDPVANLASPNVTVKVDNVVSGGVTAPLTGAVVPGCVLVADPTTYNDASGSYPIIAVTNLLAYATGNVHKAPLIQGLISNTVNNSSFSSVAPGYVALSSTAQSQITSAIRQCVLP